jgi:hypothetical protein
MRTKVLAFLLLGLLTSAAAASITSKRAATRLTAIGGQLKAAGFSSCPDGDCCPCPDGCPCPDCCDDSGCCGLSGKAAPAPARHQACPVCGQSSCPLGK